MLPNRGVRAEPIQATPQPVQSPPSPPVEQGIALGVGSMMISSLPPIASGADVYMRQFYRGSQLPYRRYLPLRGL